MSDITALSGVQMGGRRHKKQLSECGNARFPKEAKARLESALWRVTRPPWTDVSRTVLLLRMAAFARFKYRTVAIVLLLLLLLLYRRFPALQFSRWAGCIVIFLCIINLNTARRFRIG